MVLNGTSQLSNRQNTKKTLIFAFLLLSGSFYWAARLISRFFLEKLFVCGLQGVNTSIKAVASRI